MYDVIFIDFDEPTADASFDKLKQRVPFAKRVSGIVGIDNAHHAAASVATTDMMFVVDADSEILPEFDFGSFRPPSWDTKYTHIWHALNPVNGAKYGYGGIKCFNVDSVLSFSGSFVDFSQTVSELKVVPIVASVTHFDQTPFHTFRAVVREVVKLTHAYCNTGDVDTFERLKQWRTTQPNTKFFQPYILGLYAADKIIAESQPIQLINDFNWIKTLWNQL